MKDLPSLPSVVTKVLEISEDSTSSASEIEKFIKADQAISSKLLRVVNSPYFGLSGQISSVGQAVVILGMTQVRNLVLSISAASMFEAKTPRAKEERMKLWHTAFGAAAAAQMISRRKRLEVKEQEQVFIGGLLTTVGSLFLLSEYPSQYVELLDKSAQGEHSLAELETKAFGFDHALVGAELSKKWKLPESLILMIGRHEGPFDGEPIPALYAVHAADRLAWACTSEIEATQSPAFDPAVGEWLGMDEDALNDIREEVNNRIQAAKELMGVFST